MEKVLCNHGEPCLMKTGLKPGPLLHKAVYICAQNKDKCSFVQQSNQKPLTCPLHSEIVAVQVWHKDQIGVNFFCTKRERGKFCGALRRDGNKENESVSPPYEDVTRLASKSHLERNQFTTKTKPSPNKSSSSESDRLLVSGSSHSSSYPAGDSSSLLSPTAMSSSEGNGTCESSEGHNEDSEELPVESNCNGDSNFSDSRSQSIQYESPECSVSSPVSQVSEERDSRELVTDQSLDESEMPIELSAVREDSVIELDTSISNSLVPDVSSCFNSSKTAYREPAADDDNTSDSDEGSLSETELRNALSPIDPPPSTASPLTKEMPLVSPDVSVSPRGTSTPSFSRASEALLGSEIQSHSSDSIASSVSCISGVSPYSASGPSVKGSSPINSIAHSSPEAQNVLSSSRASETSVASVTSAVKAASPPTVKDVKDVDVIKAVKSVDLVGDDSRQFKVGHQSKTVMRQYMEIQHMLETQAAHLPDGGAQLRVQLAQLKKRLNHFQMAPPTVLDHSQVVQLSQRNLVAQSKLLSTGAIVHLHSSLENCPTDEDLEEDPPGLSVPLMKHQRRALAWLLWRERQTPAAGILADEMGLGKTLSMLSLMLKKKDTREEREEWMRRPAAKSSLVKSSGTLVVCPASLMLQWEEEARSKLRGQLSVYVYHGKKITTYPYDLVNYDMVVTTYTIVGDEGASCPSDEPEPEVAKKKKKRTVNHTTLFKIHWKRVILDEAHNIKNPGSAMSTGACKLSADYRWAVTGTPIQNKLKDFFSLIKFIHLAPFDDARVWKETVEKKGSVGMQRLNTMVSSLVLRRTKAELGLNLPKKFVEQHSIKLNEEEMAIHQYVYSEARKVMYRWLQEKGEDVGVNPNEEPDSGSMHTLKPDVEPIVTHLMRGVTSATGKGSCVLWLLLRLRQCCCHMKLLVSGLDGSTAESKDDVDLDLRFDALSLDTQPPLEPIDLYNLPRIFKQETMSTKVAEVVKEIKRIVALPDSPPQKCVVVSQWTKMLDIVDFQLAVEGVSSTRIDGTVNPGERLSRVKLLNLPNKNPSVMLLSLKAGGVGLNLVGANHLFILDMHWNPALEDQAADRCHRVGQNRDVYIHKFVCMGTVEERILKLQAEKLQLASNVMTGASQKSRSSASKLSLTDLKNLFELN